MQVSNCFATLGTVTVYMTKTSPHSNNKFSLLGEGQLMDHFGIYMTNLDISDVLTKKKRFSVDYNAK